MPVLAAFECRFYKLKKIESVKSAYEGVKPTWNTQLASTLF